MQHAVTFASLSMIMDNMPDITKQIKSILNKIISCIGSNMLCVFTNWNLVYAFR